ncbi:hypothetical protein [Olivibacter sitiensis]|uniref:hypothetical protein n=1 Tax=Olivibacter sitiensis TaxID=376470 RepID=UPI000414E512|nr:hypothetical protein [Olivibacter sitiensis]
MNKLRNYLVLGLFALGIVGFSACSKDDPEPENPEEEFAKVIFNFIELEDHGDHFDETTDTVIVEFGEDGNSTRGHYDLVEGHTYRLKVVAYDFAGREMQQEFVEDADDHQFFFTGAPDGVLDYVYEDDQVGVTGRFTVLEHADEFVMNAVLRHGLNKSRATAADWNNPDHASFGGSTDMDLRFPLHLVEGDDHDHDH